ncbi:class IV lanthionine synthetase LanL [Plantactinospora sonchi]|uniref:non-specific serine/threonine protein kinase n=1 Tax=Plantactinospora sonchi TaxID=1544735 RepID=A0ABU7RR02_9ACTN
MTARLSRTILHRGPGDVPSTRPEERRPGAAAHRTGQDPVGSEATARPGVAAVAAERRDTLAAPAEAVADLLARIQLAGWTVYGRSGRTVVTPALPAARLQGWHLQVSATVLSAPEVLAACAPLLIETDTPFTFVSTVEGVVRLNGARAPRAAAGRFLIAYPANDDLFRNLVRRLDEATVGMPGPTILSAWPFRAGGVVHYRYGLFRDLAVRDLDGVHRRCLVDPDGNLVEDALEVVFRPPAWAGPAFDSPPGHLVPPAVGTSPATAASTSVGSMWSVTAMRMMGPTGAAGPVDVSSTGPAEPAGALVGGRYAVTAALRQANQGGVYRARDLRTGAEVLIKEARPHVATDALGRDVRELLGHEARVLRHLAPLGVVPRPLREFVQGDHRFLVEELLPGRRLAELRPDPVGTGGNVPETSASPDPVLQPSDTVEPSELLPPDPVRPLDVAGLLPVVHRLAHLLRAVHAMDVVVRDLSPDNVLVLPDGTLRLIDLESAALRTGGPDDWARFDGAGAESAYHAPEQVRGSAPDPTADLFSLGMTALHLVGRAAPAHHAADLPPRRSLEERVAALLEPPLGGRPLPDPVRRIISGLLRTEPTDRIGLDEVISLCAPVPAVSDPVDTPADVETVDELPTLPHEDWAELIDGIVGQLAHDLGGERRRAGADFRWAEARAEPCTVQDGIAGPVAVLARLVADGGSPAGPDDAELLGPGTVRRAGRLLDSLLDRLLRHLDQERHAQPGLYAGAAGTAWALCDAGRLLGRPELVDRAVELALRLPVVWPDPGLGHGVAGLGTGLLQVWRHTYLPALRDRITAAAAHLLDTVQPGPAMLWTVDPSCGSGYAGHRSYGALHGTAGIGGFLLAAGHRLGRRDLVAAAVRCGDTLLDAARYDNTGAARWPAEPGPAPEYLAAGPDGPAGLAASLHRCTGPAGIGSFLCRLYVRSGERRHLDGAVAAARTVFRGRWWSDTGYCHGLAGDADFLLDLARVTAENRYARQAEALGRRLWAMRFHRDGRAVLPDGSDQRVSPGFGAGLSGHLAFLLRLRYGGPRLFQPDPDPVGQPGVGEGSGARVLSGLSTGADRTLCAGGRACRC